MSQNGSKQKRVGLHRSGFDKPLLQLKHFQVVGYVERYGINSHAFLYSNGQMQDLGALGGDHSNASGINNLGQVVGSSQTSNGSVHAFLYSNGQMQDLGTLGGDYSEAHGINDVGQVTGISRKDDSSSERAFLYSNGQMRDLGEGSAGYALNNAGEVTGSAFSPELGLHAILYSGDQFRELGQVGSPSIGSDINNLGQVVGSSADFGPLFYSNGQLYNPNALLDPALGIHLISANAINDHGQIVAVSGLGHTYLLTPLTPIPEPSTLALCGVALLGLGAWARRRRSFNFDESACPPRTVDLRHGHKDRTRSPRGPADAVRRAQARGSTYRN